MVDVGMAQAALVDGVADLVDMTRAQLADPDVVAHVRAGTPERIRPSTLSNARTAVRDPRNPIISDDVEPRTGYESVDPPLGDRAACPRDVLVVGGGPAGMEAARVLALRGHRVRLAERCGELGEALLLAAAIGGRARLGLPVPWWCRELARLGVDVALGTEVGAAELDEVVGRGEALVLATGSRDGPRDYPCDVPVLSAAAVAGAFRASPRRESPAATGRVVHLDRAAAQRALPGGAVVVHDPVGDWVGAGVAEQLAAAGRAVTLVTPDAVAGTQVHDVAGVNGRLQRAGVRRELRSRLLGAAGGVAELEHVWTGERRTVPCAAVVYCGHRLPDDTLWRARPQLPRAGDCVAPRTLHEAVREGRRAALAVEAATPVLAGVQT